MTAKEFCYLTVDGNAWDSAVCEVEHKRKSGKVAKEVTIISISTFEKEEQRDARMEVGRGTKALYVLIYCHCIILDECVPSGNTNRKLDGCQCLGRCWRHARYR